MSEIKETLLRDQFVTSSIELAEIQMDEEMDDYEKKTKLEGVWRAFITWHRDNFVAK